MKQFLLISLFAFSSLIKADDSKFFCSTYNVYMHIDLVEKLNYDKQKHCSLACMLAQHCLESEVRELGWFKEIADYLGMGTPDEEDLAANDQGILLARQIKTHDECRIGCKKIYP